MKQQVIGFTQISSGRLGNRLFQYHFLRQLAGKLSSNYFHPQLPDSIYFKEMDRKRRSLRSWMKVKIYSSEDIRSFEPPEFVSELQRQLAKGSCILFKPPILGECFFDHLYDSPSRYLMVKDDFRYPLNVKSNSSQPPTNIAIHFRGTDFEQWNPHAALKFEYYKNAILFCKSYFSNTEINWLLFTDDDNYDAYCQVIDFLRHAKESFIPGNSKRLAIYDFYHMSCCEVLISSPSTFSILAGAIGKRKKIIHSKDWLLYAVTKNDPFWVKLNQAKNPYYKLWEAI